MQTSDGSVSFYFFDIDDNLLFLPTRLYLWNAETKQELVVSSREFANIQNLLGRSGKWQPWSMRSDETFRDFRDTPGVAPADQPFVRDLKAALDAAKTVAGDGEAARAGASGNAGVAPPAWQGPSWPLLVHACKNQRPIAVVTARGHAPSTIEAGLSALVAAGWLARLPPILGIYAVTNPEVRQALGATDQNLTVPSVKKMAIRDAVEKALQRYGAAPPHRFGMSDDDPNNVVLAISAMRSCKEAYPDKRFFVINTNEYEFVKLEIFPMAHPVTAHASGAGVLQETPAANPISGGNASVYITDMDRAIAFYVNALGLRLKARIKNEWAEIDAGQGLVIGLHPAHEGTAKPGDVGAINIELAATKPLEEVVAGLIKANVVAGPIAEWPDVRLVTVNDPDGNAIMLAQVLHH